MLDRRRDATRRMSRGQQLYRQWTILNLLSAGRKSRRELAEQLSVSRKTITRDLQALSIFPIFEEREGIDVYYQLVRGARTPNLRFDREELAALVHSRRTILAALAGAPQAARVATALDKVEHLYRGHGEPDARREVYGSGFEPPGARVDVEPLLQAAIERRLVWMRYYTAERARESERVVEPYFVHRHARGLHLIAFCQRRGDFLYFNVNCIRELRVLERAFDPSARAFQLDAFLSTVFDGQRAEPVIDVCLRIQEPTAHWARDHFYHRSQVVTEVEGGVEIRFRSGAPAAIAARALSLGPDCEVLAPPSLRRLVAELAQAVARRYAPTRNFDRPGPDLSRGADSVPPEPSAVADATRADIAGES